MTTERESLGTNKAIGRKRKKNGFTQIANTLVEDSRLSWKAKMILVYLLSRPDYWRINKKDIENRATDGRESVQNGLNELKELGYLHIYQDRNEKGQMIGWVWEYDDVPFATDERQNRNTDNQQEIGETMQENRMTENPNYGEPELRETRTYNNTVFNNTVLSNTKEKKNKDKKINSPVIDREFEKIWALYPRKVGRAKAFQHFKKARKIKKIPYEIIENGLYRYIRYLEQQGTDEQYIMHGSTWFSQEKWQDEYVLTGIKQKAKSPEEYLRQKYAQDGVSDFEYHRNRKVVNDYDESIPDIFQGF
jgi:Helix-turn-helix domain